MRTCSASGVPWRATSTSSSASNPPPAKACAPCTRAPISAAPSRRSAWRASWAPACPAISSSTRTTPKRTSASCGISWTRTSCTASASPSSRPSRAPNSLSRAAKSCRSSIGTSTPCTTCCGSRVCRWSASSSSTANPGSGPCSTPPDAGSGGSGWHRWRSGRWPVCCAFCGARSTCWTRAPTWPRPGFRWPEVRKRPEGGKKTMDAAWRADAHRSMWRLAGDHRLLELWDTARGIAREVVMPALAAGAADSPVWTAAKSGVLDSLDRAGLTSLLDRTQAAPALSLSLAAAELAVADGGAATCLLSGYLAHSVVRDFGTPEQRARYLDRRRYPHAALCLTEPPPGAGVDALTLTGTARLVMPPGAAPGGAAPMLDVKKRGRLISHMEFADFVLLAVDSPGGGCLILAEPGDEGLFDRGQPGRRLGRRLALSAGEGRLGE